MKIIFIKFVWGHVWNYTVFQKISGGSSKYLNGIIIRRKVPIKYKFVKTNFLFKIRGLLKTNIFC